MLRKIPKEGLSNSRSVREVAPTTVYGTDTGENSDEEDTELKDTVVLRSYHALGDTSLHQCVEYLRHRGEIASSSAMGSLVLNPPTRY